MKNVLFKNALLWIAIAGTGLSACGPASTTASMEMELKLTGEMLFEGSNTLQYSGSGQLAELAGEVGVERASIRSVRVTSAVIELDGASRQMTESMLLQIVSDQNELTTIGTLNPLPGGNVLSLSLAEDPSILPYLTDAGTTWVLDINITEDHLDEFIANGKLELSVDYIPNKN
jgi:hypothetical protein